MIKIGSPLFILRDECEKDLMKVLEKLSEIGYDGIEFLGFFGNDPVDIKKKLDSCGLIAIGDHVPFYEFVENTGKLIAERKEIGCSYITVSPPKPDGLPGGYYYPDTLQAFRVLGEKVNEAGMTMLYHNHAEELRTIIKGKSILEHILDDTDIDLLSPELDLGWIEIGGGDPEYYLNKYKNRCPVVHFKDYSPANNKDGFEFRPTGYGVLNNAALFTTIMSFDIKPEWYVMDHDCAYDRNIYDDMALSLEYFRNLDMITN